MKRFVEIIAGFALALDISTLSSVASGHFASSHERLGRNRPDNGLREVHLNKEFFRKVVGSRGMMVEWKPFKVDIHDCHPIVVCVNVVLLVQWNFS